MNEAHDILVGAGKIVNDTLRELFFDSELVLLKSSSSSNRFSTVLTVDDSWFFEYSNTRQSFRLEISRDDNEIAEAMAEATHIRVDDDVYVIRDGDTVTPKGMDTSWKVFCDRFTQRSQFGPLY